MQAYVNLPNSLINECTHAFSVKVKHISIRSENEYALRFFTNNLMFNQNMIKVCTGNEIYMCFKLFENQEQMS